MHSIAFTSLGRLSSIFKALNSPEVVAHQDEAGGWYLDVPDRLASAAEAMAAEPVMASKADLMAYAEAARFTKETAGIEVGGAVIATDRQSQGMITGAFSLIQARPDTTIRFKATSGFVKLTASQMVALAIAVAEHVQACFDLEDWVIDQIEAGTISTMAEIDAAFAA